MSLYLKVREVGGSMAIATCPRCSKKMYYGDLKLDPNNKNYYCEECVDPYDPYRLPARQSEDIGLQHPRIDVNIDPGAW